MASLVAASVPHSRVKESGSDTQDLLVLSLAAGAALLYGDSDGFFQTHPTAVVQVREHAVMRRRQAIPLDAVIREYTRLRDELWGAIWCDLHGSVHSADVYYLQKVLTGTLDRIIELTTRTYLQPQP